MPRKKGEGFTDKVKRKAEDIVDNLRSNDKEGESKQSRAAGRRDQQARRSSARSSGERSTRSSPQRGRR